MNLVVHLILVFLSSGRSYTNPIDETRSLCHEMCPAGFHKTAKCDGSEKYKCEQCLHNTFTAKENFIEKCHRCGICKTNEVELKPCTFNSNVVCDCKEGYYYASDYKVCQPCQQSKDDTNADYRRKCCNSTCPNGTKCHEKCSPDAMAGLATSTSTTMLTKLFTTTTTRTTTTFFNATSNPVIGPVPPKGLHNIWVALLVVIFVLVFGPLLMKITLESTGTCHCWSIKKKVDQHPGNPIFNEQHSHPGNSSTTVTLDVCVENPMRTFSPCTSENSSQMSPLLPHTEHKADKQEHSKHLPAFVHYEIIKEVPLRRWKEFLRLLSVDDKQLERAELEAGLGVGSMERQYQMLRLWSQQSSASLNDVFTALHYMDLSGCAQKLQENLEKLQWWYESKQTFTAHRNHADQDFGGALQDTGGCTTFHANM